LESFRDQAVRREKTDTPLTLKEIESGAEGMAHPTIEQT
jgi:hypothetical protein